MPLLLPVLTSIYNPDRVESYPEIMISVYPSLFTSANSIELAMFWGRELESDESMANGSCPDKNEMVAQTRKLCRYFLCHFI